MTRKCIMCKSKNYKNACSFFSAPKDIETRRLWKEAINIKDYTVSDETYVCSKHFNKDDIITHWVSGVPPQVITIKYKKCRLRKGAIPIPINTTSSSQNNVFLESQENGIVLDGKKYFIPSKKKDDSKNKIEKTEEVLNESLNCNLEDEIYEYIPEDSQEQDDSKNEVTLPQFKKQKLILNDIMDKQDIVYSSSNHVQEILYINCTNENNMELKENKNNLQIHVDNSQDILTLFPKKTYSKINEKEMHKTTQNTGESNNQTNSAVNWQIDALPEKFDMDEISEQYNKDQFKDNFEHIHNSMIQKKNDYNNLMLFEDFLDIYNEVSLPINWFASTISKGCNTTVVYSSMNISSIGVPYVEKKVFLNSNMIIRIAIFNKELDVTSFFKNGKSQHVYALSDVEDFIEEFDQVPICTGISNQECLNENFSSVIFNAESWRHVECPILLTTESPVCLKCTSLIDDKTVLR